MAQPLTLIETKPSARFISRDEMNLAEFPLTVLSTRSNPSIKTLEFRDTIYDRSGSPIDRQWVITGADKFGLPTASDDEVLLGLIKLTVDVGLQNRKIFFTRYELLRILRWTTEGRSYSRLQNALDRLSGVRIKATNAFYDNEAKAHSTRNFGIIDAYEINDGRDSHPKPSFFTWSEVLFKSFQVGFIKKLDLDFFLGLESAVTRRLYRYLDKHFWYKSRITSNLFTLAHEKIGVSRNYRYPSSLRQQLDPALEELVAKGFLAGFEYSGKGEGTEITFFAARGAPRSQLPSAPQTRDGMPAPANVPHVESEESLPQQIVRQLVDRGLRDPQARALVRDKSHAVLARMQKIIEHFDHLAASRSHLLSKSPIGFLYRAVERPERFVLPGEKRQTEMGFSAVVNGASATAPRSPSVNQQQALESEYLTQRKKELQRLRLEIQPELLSSLRGEVEKALENIRGLISEDRFAEAVEHGVEEKVAQLFAVPDFREWSALRKKG